MVAVPEVEIMVVDIETLRPAGKVELTNVMGPVKL